jgi:hypothetical protein
MLERRIADDLPPVYADAEKAGRIVINLVVNAVKFSPEGSVVVVWAEAGPEGAVEIGITDSGPGISDEHQQLIFERFQQVGDPHRSSTKGFGLGLNIAKELTALNLGRMRIVSRVGRGSTFSFTLPVAHPSAIVRHYLDRLADYNPPGTELVLLEIAAAGFEDREEELCGELSLQGQAMDLLLAGSSGSSHALLLCATDDAWGAAQNLRRSRQRAAASTPAGPPLTDLEARMVKVFARPVDTTDRDAVISHIAGVIEDVQAHACGR